jgi:hypothetical protein
MVSTTCATTAPPRHGQLTGLARVVGVQVHTLGQVLHGGRGFFQAGGLLLGAGGQVHVATGNLL